jgi:signal transduction histidine kinase
MGLASLVLAVVLAISVVSGYQAQRGQIDRAMSYAGIPLNDDDGISGQQGIFGQQILNQQIRPLMDEMNSKLVGDTLQQVGIALIIWVLGVAAFLGISVFLSRIALKPVEVAWARQKQFIADASHELKTPLTVILANNNIMLAHPERSIDDNSQGIESTQLEAERMNGLVRDLLMLAQTDMASGNGGKRVSGLIGAGGADGAGSVSETQTLDLSELTNRSILQFDAVFFERGINQTDDIDDGIAIRGNEKQLNRLLAILFDNASKYCKPAGQPWIHVSLKRSGDGKHTAVLSVSNSGTPIPADKIPHLFERFYRGDEAHSDAEGYGLGLSLARNIVEAHGGGISVASTAANGTTFTVLL